MNSGGLEEGRIAARRCAHLQAQRREAEARCRGVSGGGIAVLGPQQPGRDANVLAKAGRPELGEGRGGDWYPWRAPQAVSDA